MHKYFIIFVSLIILQSTNGQIIRYVSRIRNCTIESETGTVFLAEHRIFQDKREHKMAATVNVTKDFNIKSIEIIVYRCSYEKSDCENFRKWKFITNMKEIVYMKNQMWTPMFAHITPKLDIPSVKKNVYHSPNSSLDAKAIITWYPECVNYYWRAGVILRDQMNKKASMAIVEFGVFTFVERIKKMDRRGTRKQK